MAEEYKTKGIKQDIFIKAVNLFNSRLEEDDPVVKEDSYDTTDGESYLFSYKDLAASLEDLDEEDIIAIRDDMYNNYIEKDKEEGKESTDKEIFEKMQKSITSNFKATYLTWYDNGEYDKCNQAKYILINEFGYKPKTINYWWIRDYNEGWLDKKK